jgi:hypothetical protein
MNREQILTRLRDLMTEKPTTKMGQIRWAWPEIQAALAVGHTLHCVHKRLEEIGIAVGYRTLSLYIGRLKREQAQKCSPEIITATRQSGKTESRLCSGVLETRRGEAIGETTQDPFANIRREREKKKKAGFAYDAFSTNKNLLE